MEISSDFSNQYNEVYLTRLEQMRKIIKAPNNTVPVSGICGSCTVIATLFLCSAAKHSILDTFRDADSQNRDTGSASYIDNDSKYMIEDETGKVFVQIKSKQLPILSSGIVLGFTGEMQGDVFAVDSLIFPESVSKPTYDSERKILIASNVLFDKNFEKLISLCYYLKGRFDDLILIGNIFSEENEECSDKIMFLRETIHKDLFIIPGPNDPIANMLPQPKMHKKLFNIECNRLQHPAQIQIDMASFLILNSSILSDLERYSVNVVSVIEILKEIVDIRYSVPNAPDTISCIPYSKIKDPFIIDSLNYLISSHCKYAHEEYNGINLIAIPDFSSSGECVLLDLKSKKSELFEISSKIN